MSKKKEKELSIPVILGREAYIEIWNKETEIPNIKSETNFIDNPDMAFDYLYLDIATNHPTKPGQDVILEKSDWPEFLKGWELGEIEISSYEKHTDKRDRYPYVTRKVFDRFEKLKVSDKKIVFDKETSDLFWKIFEAASGKEIMFYGELDTPEETSMTYNVKGINFPPQINYSGFVETADDTYEKWIFDEIILKGKKIPLHVHTHPDFSAFSSPVDERQIKKFIEENEGNPFIIQLIVSNPKKGRYFVRWFDLENDTWETPEVVFTYAKNNYDVESEFPGIFQFEAPPRAVTSLSSRYRSTKYKGLNDDHNVWFSNYKRKVKTMEGLVLDDEDEDQFDEDEDQFDEDEDQFETISMLAEIYENLSKDFENTRKELADSISEDNKYKDIK